MSRIYLKIFIGFWVINILTILGHNLYGYWFDIRPEDALLRNEENPYDRFAVRGLNATIDALMHYNLSEIRSGVGNAAEWVFRRVFIVDDTGYDLRRRAIPPEIDDILTHLSLESPSYRVNHDDQTYAARMILLPDGHTLKIVSFSTPFHGRRVIWQFYFSSNYRYFLLSILISGGACLFFARHMSHDFRALQNATRDIAKGDLSVRIAPQFEKRHDEIAQLSRDFDEMTVRLEKSMQEQKRLIKDVSHELRSPLARLQFALGIVQQRTGDLAKDELDRAREAADYLNDIITTILSFPTSEAETWELNDAIDIRGLLESMVRDFRDEAAEKGVSIVFESELDEAVVATYSNTLIGVFENVVRNALHYTLPNTTITVLLDRIDTHFRVAISDQGPGVAENELEDIFEPFYRTDAARDRASGGYGLGLSIAQRTITLHRGHIRAANRAEGGLRVEVVLPVGDFEQ